MLIAQLTDIHAGTNNDNLARLRRVINWLKPLRPDLLMVTGDVIDDGWLADALESASGPALVFMHHHLFASGIAPIDAAICQGVDGLKRVVADSRRAPIALCSGHVHRSMSSMVAGIPAHICGSICPANPLLLADDRIGPVIDAPALMIHHLRQGMLVSHHVTV